MASLQTLRNKGGLIVAIVIGVALLAFVLGDMFTSGAALFGEGRNVGEIDGKTISVEEYSAQVKTLTEVVKITNGSQTIGEQETQVIQSQAWQQLVMTYAIMPQLKEIGIRVGVEEMTELLTGREASPMVQQYFRNPETGAFDVNLVRQFLANVEQDATGSLQLFWDNLTVDVHNEALVAKMQSLVNNGIYVTGQQARFYADVEGANFNVRFVAEKLSEVADSTINVTDAEIRAYHKAHPESFKRTESRSIEYVVFDALPSQKDYAAAAKYIETLKADFLAAEDVQQFAQLNSQVTPGTRYFKADELSGELAEFAFGDNKDGIYAPAMAANKYTLTRIADKKMMFDSVNISAIVLEPTSTALADSLMDVIKRSPAKYGELASEYSLAPTTSDKAGEIGTVDPQLLFAEMTEELMTMRNGEVRLLTTPNSLFILKLNSTKNLNEKVQLADVEYTVEPSEETRASVYNRASLFANNATHGGFAKSATDSMLSVRTASLTPTQRELSGFSNSRSAVSWAYNNKRGALSDVMEFGDSYLVASLSKITEDGVAPVEDVASQIRSTLVQEKKAQEAAKRLTGGSVDAVAAKLGVEVIEGSDINFNTYIAPEVGFDPTFAGAVVALERGKVSKPVEGKSAAYLIEVTDVVSNPASVDMVRERLEAAATQQAFSQAYETMLTNSNITDTRYKFF